MNRTFLSIRRASVLGLLFAGSMISAAPHVVAQGNPPLTSEMVGRAAWFFEWALEAKFTAAQQQEYESKLVRDWQDEEKRKSTLALLQNVEKLSALPEEKKQNIQKQIQSSLLESFRKETQDPDAQWMLAIYTAAHPAGSSVQQPAEHYGPLDRKQLVGKWRATHGSAVQYADAATGAMAPLNGSSFFYEFHPDGTYSYNGLMQVTTYGCSTQVYNAETGKWRVDGDRLVVETAGGKSRVAQTCGANHLYEKPAAPEKREYVAHFESNPNGAMLVINGLSGKTRPDYFRPEK